MNRSFLQKIASILPLHGGRITRQEKLIGELTRNGHRLSTILDSVNDAIFIHDAETGAILDSNKTAQEMFQRSADEMRKTSIESLSVGIPPYTQAEADELLRRSRTEPLRFEWNARRKNGELFWIELNTRPVSMDTGDVVVITARDITQKKKESQELTEANEKLLKIFRGIPEILTVSTIEDGRFVDINDAFTNILGYTREEVIGRPVAEIGLWHPYWQREMLIRKFKEEGLLKNQEVTMRKRSGEIAQLLFSASCISVNGAPHLLGIGIDVTERKKIEESLSNIQKFESLGALAGGIAHDFNNLLGGLAVSLDLAKAESSASPDVIDRIDKAFGILEKATSLTQQLQTFGRTGELAKALLDLRPLLQQTADLVFSGSNIQAVPGLRSNLWLCEADASQISQALTNLLVNAREAMPSGGSVYVLADNIQLTDGAVPPLPAGDYVRISIRDEGTGIAPEDLKRIFEPFYSTKEAGSGLGLSVAYSIIRKHGGQITAQSTPGTGTLFQIYLPSSHVCVSPQIQPPPAVVRKGGRVLIMDDEEFLVEALAEMLSGMGFTPILASNGTEAVNALKASTSRQVKIDAAILDLTVRGDKGGKEALEELLKIDPTLKAVASSGYPNDPVMAEPLKYGFKGTLAKPYRVADLEKVLAEVLG